MAVLHPLTTLANRNPVSLLLLVFLIRERVELLVTMLLYL
jgi:hypothetical protein